MADYILVDFEAMETAITKYQNVLNELQDAYDNIAKAREHLDNCYKGPGYLALSAKLQSIELNVRTADNGLRESITGLRKNKANWIRVEGGQSASAGGMDVGYSNSMG